MVVPIVVTLVGIVTAVNDVHDSKAWKPSVVDDNDDDDDDDVSIVIVARMLL